MFRSRTCRCDGPLRGGTRLREGQQQEHVCTCTAADYSRGAVIVRCPVFMQIVLCADGLYPAEVWKCAMSGEARLIGAVMSLIG